MRRGRPPGSGARSTEPAREATPAFTVKLNYAVDPTKIVTRQLTMLGWAQQCIRDEFARRMNSKNPSVEQAEIVQLEKLSNGILRAIEAMRRSEELTEEIANKLSPDQLIEALLKKLERQDAATVKYAIKRLRAHLERIAPDGPVRTDADKRAATDLIAELDK